MGTIRARQLCWAILGLLFLQGRTGSLIEMGPLKCEKQLAWLELEAGKLLPEGPFSSLSLVTEPTSPNTGEKSSSEFGSPRLLFSSSIPATSQKTPQSPLGSRNPVTGRSSVTDGHSFKNLTQAQAQKHTAELSTGAPHSSSSSGGGGSSTRGETSQNDTSNSVTMDSSMMEDLTILPSPTLATVLTVAAFGVISFIVILVVVVIILVGVVSLRFKCRKNKESEDPQKPGSSGLSESCSTANGEKDSITLISMKNINMNNSKGCPSAEKVL
ncbi:endothelial cell-specific chemotaxis regulator isoform X1 [Marmota monax]|uniref:endothelial cell-specific chemotaxis regulator isoform X1 n=1 Tax=Marmota monax TaxID=9995 RepID=UPI001EAFC016|nr:endothelial cell-specific chemotaxis regulator isoform X1 [Marmota monax]